MCVQQLISMLVDFAADLETGELVGGEDVLVDDHNEEGCGAVEGGRQHAHHEGRADGVGAGKREKSLFR